MGCNLAYKNMNLENTNLELELDNLRKPGNQKNKNIQRSSFLTSASQKDQDYQSLHMLSLSSEKVKDANNLNQLNISKNEEDWESNLAGKNIRIKLRTNKNCDNLLCPKLELVLETSKSDGEQINLNFNQTIHDRHPSKQTLSKATVTSDINLSIKKFSFANRKIALGGAPNLGSGSLSTGIVVPKAWTPLSLSRSLQQRIKIKIENFKHHNKGLVSEYYDILEHIGQGGFGSVSKVTHKATKQIRAMKTIPKHKFIKVDPTQEFEILKQLDHPNILKFYEHYEDLENYYLIMEYCHGGELLKKMRLIKTFSERSAALIMLQILSAIRYCHEKNIVHRDLKLENLLLENENEDSILKVIDFGTSKIFNQDEMMNERFGTPHYIAPEVLKGHYNEKCDLWSAGIILFILLSGNPPFHAKTKEGILKKIKNGTYSLDGREWLYISKDAKEFIMKLLEYNPKQRISTKEALGDKWLARNTTNIVEIMTETALTAFNNLSSFRATSRLQEAVLAYMATHMQDHKNEGKIFQIFHAFDTNKDGFLSRDELIQIYIQLFGDKTIAHIEINRIINQVDLNQNGVIDYTEFLMANTTNSKLLTNEKLRIAFTVFDTDGDGEISPSDLKNRLGIGEYQPDEYWEDIIGEVDINNDGRLNFEEFNVMMQALYMENPSFTSGIRPPKMRNPPKRDPSSLLACNSQSFNGLVNNIQRDLAQFLE